MKNTLFLHYTGIFQRVKKKKKMVGILVYAKLMIILQICHRVIFVLKNKIYNIKYSDFKGCVRFFFKNWNSRNVYKVLRRMKNK